MLEIISSISTYNVVYAGAWDQSKKHVFFQSLKSHGLFFFFPPLRLRGCYWKQQPETWKLHVIGSLFAKNEISRTYCLSQILEPCGCEWRWIFVNKIWEVKGLVLASEIFLIAKNILCFFMRKRAFLAQLTLMEISEWEFERQLFQCGTRINKHL